MKLFIAILVFLALETFFIFGAYLNFLLGNIPWVLYDLLMIFVSVPLVVWVSYKIF